MTLAIGTLLQIDQQAANKAPKVLSLPQSLSNSKNFPSSISNSTMPMKKAQSVDLSRIRRVANVQSTDSTNNASRVASRFSNRLAHAKESHDEMHICTKDPRSTMPFKYNGPNGLADYHAYPSCEKELWGKGLSTAAADCAVSTDDSRLRNEQSYVFRLPEMTFTLGKLSALFLIIASLANVSVTKLSQSKDAFPRAHPRSSLGSAAISSVTDALSPILPFTGGLDLRRPDYWTSSESWIETLRTVSCQVIDAFTSPVPSIDESATILSSNYSADDARRKQKGSATLEHYLAISAQQPFLGTNKIADLTLGDIADIFRYAMESSLCDFDDAQFKSQLNDNLRGAVQAMDAVAVKSRGVGVREACFNEGSTDIESFKFIAAMRIFAEWRLLRQVPEGYKGFAVGMSLGHKDVVQNVAKIEQAAHNWIDDRASKMESGDDLQTPSLRELLVFEDELGIHPNLPRLKDKTGAMGLLWVRRQLHYQTRLFDNLISVPEKYASTKDAVSAAYLEVYGQYHGWAVQKIFNYSFQAAPEATEIYRHMNPRLLESLRETATLSLNGSASGADSSSEDAERNPIDDFLQNVGGNWDRFTSWIGNGFKDVELSQASSSQQRSANNPHLSSEEIERFITEEMTKDAYEHISHYLKIVYPLLFDNLGPLFEDLNMDDPTKV